MTAWSELSRMEQDEVWHRFHAGFDFRPSVHAKDWPGIREPLPFRTWLAPAPWSAAERADVHARALAAFRQLLPNDGVLAALDWQHTCYWFRPHVPFDDWGVAPNQLLLPHPFPAERSPRGRTEGSVVAPDEARWRIPVLPDGDYSIFLPSDQSWGWFAHPWEQTICVFGEPLLAVLGERPAVFRTLLREG